MKIKHWILGITAATALIAAGCHGGERAGAKVDKATEKTGAGIEKAADKTGDAVKKAGDKTEDAVKK